MHDAPSTLTTQISCELEKASQMKKLTCIFMALLLSCSDGVVDSIAPSRKRGRPNYNKDLLRFNGKPVDFSVATDIYSDSIIQPESYQNGVPVYFYSVECDVLLECSAFKMEINNAVKAWERTGIAKFKYSDSYEPHLRISIESSHSSSCDGGFDSRFLTIAHTNSCPIREIHLNRDLNWSLNGTHFDVNNVKYDVQTVVMHELGHFLGDPHHSSDENSLMYSEYQGTIRNVDSESIERIQNARYSFF